MFDASDIARAQRVLDDAGVVLVPSDTVLGLAARPDRPDAVARIFALKQRPAQKNLPVMVAHLDQLAPLGAQITPVVQRLAASPFCPGPLSIVLGVDPRVEWLRGRTELAFRIPNHAGLLALLRAVGPLVVTSANRSGCPTPTDPAQAVAELDGQPDFVLPGVALGGVPSTLVNCRVTPPQIERLGAVPADILEAYWS